MSILNKIKNSLRDSYIPTNASSSLGESIFDKGSKNDTELGRHKEIIDAFLALGYDLDEITIRKGHPQEYALSVIEAYGFDYEKDRHSYKKTPQDLINAFVEANFETAVSILNSSFVNINNSEGIQVAVTPVIDFTAWMDENLPDWRNAVPKKKATMLTMHLSDEEQSLIDSSYSKDNNDTK